jgi:signal transduction histidine kinase
MESVKKISGGRKNRAELLEEALPHFESFIESREKYIKALEQTIDVLKHENENRNRNNLDIRSSIDELVAMQRLSNTISTAMTPDTILSSLIDLTRQVIPVVDSNIYLLDASSNRLLPLSPLSSSRLQEEAQEQLESGIVDWVFSEKKTVIIPDLKSLVVDTPSRNFVIVPLFVRNAGIGIYLIHTEKAQQEFSNQDIQLLSILANQAAAGVENWRTYDQLVQANQELKTSEAHIIHAARLAAIGELAASIVHEIKNPVQVLMLQLDVMKRGTIIPNADELLRQQVNRLSEITKRLMNFSRNVTDEFTIAPTDVSKAILDAVAMVEHEYKLDKIEFQIEAEGQLPLIPGNVSYLQQVFLNLAINARDAMPAGGKVTIRAASDYYGVTVRFSDTGMGIDDKTMEKIFKPFFTTKEEGKGTGLGLAICRKIVAQHQGTIKAESIVGKGTTFIIVLPLRRSS